MNKFAINRVDFSILLPALILVGISLATFYSIDPGLFRQQLVFLVFALFVYFIFLNLDHRLFGFFSKFLYIGMVLLLASIFIIGVEAKGSVRWIDIFGIRLQFSEIIKPFFIIVFAYFLTNDSSRVLGKYIKAFLLLAPIFFLTLFQPDLGNAAIYLFALSFMILMYGFPFLYYVVSLIFFLVPLPFLYNFLHDYQKKRILSFVNITSDPFGSSYNAIQALIAVGSGGIFGKGFGQATQSTLKFLPERHTDFIFATISESLGFIGGAFVIVLYGFLLFRIYKIAVRINTDFTRLIVFGYFFLFLIHVFLNIGMNIGLVPIVGITLPFVSYGGSSLLTNFIILGILSSILFEHKQDRAIDIM